LSFAETLRKRDHLEDLVVEVRIILITHLKEIECGEVDWFGLAQDKNN
jgi:hypothetical protein